VSAAPGLQARPPYTVTQNERLAVCGERRETDSPRREASGVTNAEHTLGPYDTLRLTTDPEARHNHGLDGASKGLAMGGVNTAISTAYMGTTMSDEDWIEIYDFNYENLTIQYGCKEGKHGKYKIKILDNKTNFIIHQEVIDVSPGVRLRTNFGYCKSFIYDAVTVVFEFEGTKILEQQYGINTTPPNHALVDFWCDQDLELYSYHEIFFDQVYARYGVRLEENDIVVDIGSNQGAFLKYALSYNVSTIISCEPNPYCVDTLKKYYGHHANIQFNPYAIAEKNGKTLLQIGSDSDKTGGGKIVEAHANAPEYYADGTTLEVETITFKDFIRQNKVAHIDFLKVDCEGSEVFIFREENAAFFRTQVHKIALEFHNDQKDEIITFLCEAGYDVHVEHGENHLGMLYAKNPHFVKGIVAYPPAKVQ
jgi:FkbM family methyltransferase